VKPYRSVALPAVGLCLLVVANIALPFIDGHAAKLAGWVETAAISVFAYLAARNLEALGESEPRFTPAQCAWWSLLPVVNIYMLHQVLTALWRESQPRAGETRRRGRDFSARTVNVWWALFLGAIGLIFVKVALQRGDGELARLSAQWGMTVIRGFAIAGRVAFMVVIAGIAARQREQWRDLEQRRAVPEPKAALR
jgi:uncharacterized protein DUF4328